MHSWKTSELQFCYICKYLLFFTANLSSVALGTTLGWTSPAFPKLTNEQDLSDSPLSFVPSKEELSWIGSLVALGALFGKGIVY